MDHRKVLYTYITATMMYFVLAKYSIKFGLIKLFYVCYKLTRYRYLSINIILCYTRRFQLVTDYSATSDNFVHFNYIGIYMAFNFTRILTLVCQFISKVEIYLNRNVFILHRLIDLIFY